MANATANASPTQLGGTGSAAQAGATGSSGGTTTGTVACSSCCATQGRYLVDFFGGYGEIGLCPGAVDNSQVFNVYATIVITYTAPDTAASVCLPASFTVIFKANSLHTADARTLSLSCSIISPPATTTNFDQSATALVLDIVQLQPNPVKMGPLFDLCGCGSTKIRFVSIPGYSPITTVSCSPPVFSFSCDVLLLYVPERVASAVITLTF